MVPDLLDDRPGCCESVQRRSVVANLLYPVVRDALCTPVHDSRFALSLPPSLIMRTSVVEVLGQDFIFYKRVTGLPKSARLKSIAKHSSLPVITLYPISMARAIGGLVLIETVFNWPGMGYALVQAVLARDFATVQFVFSLSRHSLSWLISLLTSSTASLTHVLVSTTNDLLPSSVFLNSSSNRRGYAFPEYALRRLVQSLDQVIEADHVGVLHVHIEQRDLVRDL
ncbi:ABC transporter permease subunit [Natrialba swarupiae]|nr:ABC transporter permease subunit [Natrialba swarupiae]